MLSSRYGTNSYKQCTYSGPVEQYMLHSMICTASISFSCAWVPYYQIQHPIASTVFSDNCLRRLMKQSGSDKIWCYSNKQVNTTEITTQEFKPDYFWLCNCCSGSSSTTDVQQSHTFLFQCLAIREAFSLLLFHFSLYVKWSSEPYFLSENAISLALIGHLVKSFYKRSSLVSQLNYIIVHTYFFHHMLQFSLYPLSQVQWPP